MLAIFVNSDFEMIGTLKRNGHELGPLKRLIVVGLGVVKFRRNDLSLYIEVISHFLVQNKNMIGYSTMSRDIVRCHITRSDLNRRLTFHIYRS